MAWWNDETMMLRRCKGKNGKRSSKHVHFIPFSCPHGHNLRLSQRSQVTSLMMPASRASLASLGGRTPPVKIVKLACLWVSTCLSLSQLHRCWSDPWIPVVRSSQATDSTDSTASTDHGPVSLPFLCPALPRFFNSGDQFSEFHEGWEARRLLRSLSVSPITAGPKISPSAVASSIPTSAFSQRIPVWVHEAQLSTTQYDQYSSATLWPLLTRFHDLQRADLFERNICVDEWVNIRNVVTMPWLNWHHNVSSNQQHIQHMPEKAG